MTDDNDDEAKQAVERLAMILAWKSLDESKRIGWQLTAATHLDLLETGGLVVSCAKDLKPVRGK